MHMTADGPASPALCAKAEQHDENTYASHSGISGCGKALPHNKKLSNNLSHVQVAVDLHSGFAETTDCNRSNISPSKKKYRYKI